MVILSIRGVDKIEAAMKAYPDNVMVQVHDCGALVEIAREAATARQIAAPGGPRPLSST